MTEIQEPKYKIEDGKIVNRLTGVPIPDDEPIMIFRGKDKHAWKAISYYCNLLLNEKHKQIVLSRMMDFMVFVENNIDKVKEPDTE